MTRNLSRGRRVRVAVAALVAAVVVCAGCAEPQEPPVDTVSASPPTATALAPDAYAAGLVDFTNEVRTAAGLPALVVSECARDQAQVRAQDLAGTGGELIHEPLGPVSAACAPVTISGENLSRAAAEPGDVVDAWMASPGHASNLLMPEYTEVGIGCVPFAGATVEEMLCSQVFLGR